MFVLLLDVRYEGQSLLGVYSSLERAEEAGRAYAQRELDEHGYWSEDSSVVVERRDLDGEARDAFFSQYEWEYRP
jgi:hypothetical protein